MADDKSDDGGDGYSTGTMVGGVLGGCIGGCIVASGLAAVLIMAKAKKTEKNVRNASDPARARAVDNPTYVDTPAVIHKKQNPMYVGLDGGLGGSGYLEVEG